VVANSNPKESAIGTRRHTPLAGVLALMAGALACTLPTSQGEGAPATVAPEATPPIVVGEASPRTLEEPSAVAAAPSGLKVAFVNENNVWLWSEESGAVPLTDSGGVTDVRLSGDGSVIAFIRRSADFTDAELCAINVDGTNERLLVSADALKALQTNDIAEGIEPHQFEWIPGTHLLAYNTRHIFTEAGFSALNNDLWVVDADTQQQRVSFPAGSGGNFYIAPDGSQIAIATTTGISLVNADGSNRRDGVMTLESISLVESEYVPAPAWSPDALSLGVVLPPGVPFSEPVGESTTWHIPTDGGPAQQLGTFLTSPIPGLGPRFSPDLSKVAYPRKVDDVWELHIANADGTGDIVYDDGPNLRFSSWASDSERFAYVDGQESTRVGQIGATPILLDDVQVASSTDIMWVDANRFLYLMQDGLNWELRMATVGQPSQLLSQLSQLVSPFSGSLTPGFDAAN
jgi:dipeptidyl aminopeptidase/acylaminoacyl peptidase